MHFLKIASATMRHLDSISRHVALTVMLLTIAAACAGVPLRAQVRSEATCVEYYTAPITDSTGAASTAGTPGTLGGEVQTSFAPGALGGMNTKGYIAHFAAYNSGFSTVTIQRDVPDFNFFYPGDAAYSVQPSVFVPGNSETLRIVVPYLAIGWLLNGTMATLTPLGMPSGDGANSLSPSLPASPTCPPQLVPSTTLSFSSPGTYTHQYLGQVNSGPPANPATTFTLMALAGSQNISVTNLSYVPNDAANPIGDPNPNSIYGDITIGAVGTGPTPLDLELTINGVVMLDGAVSVTY
jgi:hypothetical protein